MVVGEDVLLGFAGCDEAKQAAAALVELDQTVRVDSNRTSMMGPAPWLELASEVSAFN